MSFQVIRGLPPTTETLDRIQQHVQRAFEEVSAAPTIATATGTYRASGAEDIILADARAGAVVVALPATLKKTILIKRTGASGNVVTVRPIDPRGTIDGSPSVAIVEAYGSVRVFSDGKQYYTGA